MTSFIRVPNLAEISPTVHDIGPTDLTFFKAWRLPIIDFQKWRIWTFWDVVKRSSRPVARIIKTGRVRIRHSVIGCATRPVLIVATYGLGFATRPYAIFDEHCYLRFYIYYIPNLIHISLNAPQIQVCLDIYLRQRHFPPEGSAGGELIQLSHSH